MRMPTTVTTCAVPDLIRDPLFKLAVGRAPDSGAPLCSQPTMSRLENMPSKIEAARLTAALVDHYCESFKRPPRSVTLDIDETVDPVHGGQQFSLFNTHYNTPCFLPFHVYDIAAGAAVVVVMRPGKTPAGTEVRTILEHLTKRIRRHWPTTRITYRADSHYGRPEAMAWCEDAGADFIFGLSGNAVLDGHRRAVADDLCVRRAEAQVEKMRAFHTFEYAAKSWTRKRKVVARLEASTRGLDIRYVVTSLPGGPQYLYESVYCARGQVENLIKLHKAQLASDRTSCQSPIANQVRLVLHTAAFWLMREVREAIPAWMPLHKCEFTTLRVRLLKIAARVVEKATRIRIYLPTAFPEQILFRLLVGRLAVTGP